MKNILLTFATLAFVFAGAGTVAAQDCSTCNTSTPGMVLFLQPTVSPPANGPGGFGTTTARFDVFLYNNTGGSRDMATIEFSMGINMNTLTSFTSVTSDASAFPNSNVFQPFPPPGNFVQIIDNAPYPYAKTLSGKTFTHHYEYDHTVSGPNNPPQPIPAGSTVQIMTINFTLDGSQTFVSNDPSNPNYFGDPNYMMAYPGECVDPDPNVNNQFGFVDGGGNQVLENCYRTVTGPPTTVLPLELTEFTGEIHDRFNKLRWKTQAEINTKWHHVERSIDPASDPFVEIGKVAAAGNSEIPTAYSLDDQDPPVLAYYRLKTEDLDGTFQFSNVIVLKRTSRFDVLSVFPNPTMDLFEVQYSVNSESDIKIEIVDVLGRVLESYKYKDPEGIIKREYDLSPYADGLYFLRVSNGVEIKSKEVIKSRP